MLISAPYKRRAGTQRNGLTSCITPSRALRRPSSPVMFAFRPWVNTPAKRLCLSRLIRPLDADARTRWWWPPPRHRSGRRYTLTRSQTITGDLLSSSCWPFVHMRRRPPGWPLTPVSRVDSRRFLIALGRFQIGLIFCLVSFCVYTFSLWLSW